jgi:hypothetical protein
MISQELSQRYDCALLNLDQIIIDAIDSPQRNEYAQRAYHMCRDALEKHIEEQRQVEVDADHAAAPQLGRKILKYFPNSIVFIFQVHMLKNLQKKKRKKVLK